MYGGDEVGESDPKKTKPQESLTNKDLKNFVDEKQAAILIEKDQAEINKLKEGKEEHEKEVKRHEDEIRKADERMEAIQRSTRTLIPQFAALHNYCRMRMSWYYKWHTNRYSSLVHWLVLALYVVALLAYVAFGGKHPASEAATTGCTWTNGNANNNWNDSGNWSCSAVPDNNRDVILNGATSSDNITINAALNVGSFTVYGTESGHTAYTGTITANYNLTTDTTNGGTGDFFLGSGTYTANATTLDIVGNFTITGGTFTAGTSLVKLRGSSKSLAANGATFNNLELAASGSGSATDTGYLSPGTMATAARSGSDGSDWSNPDNAKTSNGTYATVYTMTYSNWLKASNFGASIPSGATIDGILVEVEKSWTGLDNSQDSSINIIKADGSIGTTNKGDTSTNWPASDTYVAHGSSSEKWGETWAYGDINDADFGVAISIKTGFMNRFQDSVDHVRIKVYYTAGSPATYTATDDFTVGGTLTTGATESLTINSGKIGTMNAGSTVTNGGTITGAGTLDLKDTAGANLSTGGTLSSLARFNMAAAGVTLPARTYGGNVQIYNNTSSNRSATMGTAGSQTLTFSGDFTTNTASTGTITIDLDTNDPAINVAGDMTLADDTTYTKSSDAAKKLIFNGTAAKTLTDSNATKQNLGVVEITKTHATASNNKITLGSSVKVDTALISASNTLDLASSAYTLDLANAGSSATVLTVTGTLTVNSSSTVKYSATNSGGNVTITNTSYNSLQVSGSETYVLAAVTTLTGNMTIDTAATFDTAASNYNLTCVDLTVNGSGTFTMNASTVTTTGNVSVNSSATITAGTSTLKLYGDTKNFAGGGKTFNNITVGGTSSSTDTGYISAGTGANVTGAGLDWSTPTNIYTSNDADASSMAFNYGGYTDYLRASNFDFSAIPDDATIDGILIEVEKMADTTSRVKDYHVYTVKSDATYCATDIKDANYWAGSDTYQAYGGAADLAGYTGATVSDIKDSDFGVVIAGVNNETIPPMTVNTYIDHIRIKVYYSTTGAAVTVTATDSATVGGTFTVATGSAISIDTSKTITANSGATVANSGTISGAGTLELKDTAAATATGGTLSSQVKFNTVAAGLTVPARTYGSNVEIYNNTSSNYSATLGTAGSQTITVTGGFTITKGSSGTITADANTYDPTINIGGSFANGGTFTAGTSTVNMNTTTTATVSGSTTFNNLTLDATATGAKQINFTAGTTQTISGTFSLTGAVGKVLTLRSTTPTSAWYFVIPGDMTSGTYIDVQDSQNTTNAYRITPGANVTNNGRNSPGWSFAVSPPAAPTIGTPSAQSTTSIRWVFADNASDETGFKVYDGSNNLKATCATADLTYCDETGMSVNTLYNDRYVVAYNDGGNSTASSTAAAIYTLANTPGAPALNLASSTSLNIIISVNSNPAATEFAIYNSTQTQYVQADGTSGASAVWQNYATWGGASGVNNTGLTAATEYTYTVKARNGDNAATAMGPQATLLTGKSWDGGGGANTNWSTAANWTNDAVPTNTDDVFFFSTSTNAVLDSSFANSIKSLTLTSTYTNSITLASNLTVLNNISIAAGTLSPASYTINVAGNWSKTGGTFTEGTSSVVFNGASGSTQTVSGTTTFHNLIASTTAARTIAFTSGTTQTITNTFFMNGAASNLLTISAVTGGSTATLNYTGTKRAQVIYTTVTDIVVTPASTWYLDANSSKNAASTGWTVGDKVKAFGATAGNWSDATKWISGIVPVAQDDVIVMATSGNLVVNAATANLRSFDLTGYAGTLSGTSALTIRPTTAGTVTCKFGGTVTFTGQLLMTPDHTSAIINFTSAGKVISRDVTVAGTGNGKVVQQDDFAPGSTSNRPALSISGTAPWDMNGYKIIGNATYRYLVGTAVTGTTSVLTLNGGAAGSAAQFEYFNARDILFNNGGSSLDLSAITGLSGDCQGNGMSGGGSLTFTTSVAQTYNGTTGNYSNDALWTTRSPLPQDDVTISNFGGSGRTLNYDKREAGRNIDFSGLTSATNKPTFSSSAGASTFNWFGTLTLASSTYLTFTYTNFSMIWLGRSNSNITTAGQNLGNLNIAGTGATLQMQDDLTASLALSLGSGIFDTQAFTVNSGTFANGTGGAKEYKGSGSIVVSGASANEFNINSSAMTWSHTGPISLTYTGSSDRVFYFGTVDSARVMTNDITISGGGAGILTFTVNAWATTKTPQVTGGTKTLKFTSGTTVNFSDTINFGNGTNVVTLAAVTAGSPVIFTAPNGGNIQHDYLDITDINVGSLVLNPEVEANTTGWTASAGGSPATLASVAGGQSGNCLRVTNTGAVAGFGTATLRTVIGETYEITVYHKDGTATGRIQIGDVSAGGSNIVNQAVTDASWTQYTIQFTATATAMYFSLRNSNVNNGTGLWDIINVKVVPTDIWYYGSNSTWRSGLGWTLGAVPTAPTIGTPTVQSATSIRWNFTDTPSTEDGFKVYDGSNVLKATCASVNLTYCDETGMAVNTLYNDRYVVAYNDYGNSTASSTAAAIYTLANTPAAPTVNLNTSTSLTVIINVNSNPAATEFAISCNTDDATFLNYTSNACESIADDADHWRTAANWGGGSGFVDTGLTTGNSYTYKVKARNGDKVNTALSSGATQIVGASVWDGGGGANTDWSTAANWTNDTVPLSSSYVIFNATSTNNSTIDASFAGTILELSINSGYSGTITASRSLTVTANMTLSQGTFDANDQTVSCVNFTSTGSITRALTMGSGTWTVTGNWDSSGSNQTINPETSTVDFTNSANITANENLSSPYDFYKLHLAHDTKTVTMYTSATVGDEVTVYKGGALNREGSTAENTGLILYKNSDALLESGSGTATAIGAAIIYQPTTGISVAGHNFTGSVYYRPDSASNIAFTLSSAITGSGTIYIYNKTDTNIATLDAGANNIQAASINIGSSVYTTAYGAFDAGSGAHELSGNFGLTESDTSTSNTLDMASSTISVGGSIDFTGISVTAGTSTVTMTATSGGKTIASDGQSFNNLTFDGVSGGWTLQDDSATAGNFTITNGTVSAGATTITDSGNFTVTSGTFTAGASTVKLQGNGKTLAANGTTFNNLELAGTGGGSSDTGYIDPGTMADQSGVGMLSWSNPSYAVSSNDSYATVTVDHLIESHYLKATNFNASVPSGATIDGIEVGVEKKGSTGMVDTYLNIVKGGTVGSTNKKDASSWPTSDAYTTYGSSTEKWGETWIAGDGSATNDVNNSTFGAVIAVTYAGMPATAYVDHMRVKIYYTAGSPATYTATDDFTVGGTLTTGATESLTINSGKIGTMNAGSTVTNGGTITGAGTLNLKDTAGANLSTGGTLSSLVRFTTATASVSIPARTYGNNVEIYNNTSSGYNATFLSGTHVYSGNFTTNTASTGTITVKADSNNPTIQIAGDMTLADDTTYTKGTSNGITFNGTAAKTYIDNNSTKQNIGVVVITKTDGTPANNKITLGSSMTVDTMTVSASNTLDLANSGYTLEIANAGSAATVFTVSGTLTTNSSSTVKYSATNSGGNITVTNTSYNNLQVSGSETYVLAATTTLTGNMTIDTAATFSTTASNYNLTCVDLTVNGSGTFTMNASTILASGNVSVNSSATITAGTSTLQLGGSSKNFAGGGKTFNNVMVGNTSVTNSGWVDPGTMADDSAVGTVAWTDVNNAKTSNDSRATFSSIGSDTSHYLKATNLDFSTIPDGSTINGIEIGIERQAMMDGMLKDNIVKVVKSDGTLCATNLASADTYTTSDVYKSYGGAADLAGYTGATAADIKDADFGLVLSSTNTGPFTRFAAVDHMRIKVYYTTTGGDASYTGTESAVVAGTLTTNSGSSLAIDTSKTITMNAGSTVTNGGTISGAGTLELIDTAGANLSTGGTLSSLIRFNTATAGATVPARTYGSNVEIYNNTSSNYSAILGTAGSQTITVAGNLTITKGSSGTMTVDANTYDPTINVGGSWTNGGTFTAGSSLVKFNSTTTAVVSGSTTFYDLTLDATADGAKQINFTAGSTQTISHTFYLTGGSGKLLTLGSTAASAWYFVIPGDMTSGTYIDVEYSQNITNAYRITAGANVGDGGNNDPGWLFGGGNSTPVNDSLTFTNPYSSNVAVADDTTEWNFEAKVTDSDGSTDIDYVMLRLANSSDSTTPYDSIRLKWTEATDTFSEDADTQSAITLTSTSANSAASGNQWTLNFKLKIDNDFLAKDTNYAAELYAIDDAAASDLDDYSNKYQVTALSLSLDVDNATLDFGSLLPGSILTGTTVATVTTNYGNGYLLQIADAVAGTNSVLLHTDTTTRIADYAGTIATPTTWSGTGLGICVFSATGKDTSKWGTGVSEVDLANKYAGVPETAATIHTKTGTPTSGDNTSIGYKLVVPNNQKTGNYSGIITYTATGALN